MIFFTFRESNLFFEIFPCDLHCTQFPILRFISRKYIFPYISLDIRNVGMTAQISRVHRQILSLVMKYFVRKLYVQFIGILQDS